MLYIMLTRFFLKYCIAHMLPSHKKRNRFVSFSAFLRPLSCWITIFCAFSIYSNIASAQDSSRALEDAFSLFIHEASPPEDIPPTSSVILPPEQPTSNSVNNRGDIEAYLDQFLKQETSPSTADSNDTVLIEGNELSTPLENISPIEENVLPDAVGQSDLDSLAPPMTDSDNFTDNISIHSNETEAIIAADPLE